MLSACLSLGNLPVDDEAYMERTVETAIRALDNVIDLNFYPLEYARLTNQKYRSIGLGVSGYHHMLAKRGIRWESDEHLAFTDAVFEHINYAAVKADTALAREKGCYTLFEGSDWQTGAYFEKRGYTSEKWQALAKTALSSIRARMKIPASLPILRSRPTPWKPPIIWNSVMQRI